MGRCGGTEAPHAERQCNIRAEVPRLTSNHLSQTTWGRQYAGPPTSCMAGACSLSWHPQVAPKQRSLQINAGSVWAQHCERKRVDAGGTNGPDGKNTSRKGRRKTREKAAQGEKGTRKGKRGSSVTSLCRRQRQQRADNARRQLQPVEALHTRQAQRGSAQALAVCARQAAHQLRCFASRALQHCG